MDKNVKISIVVPVYNTEKYVEKSVRSIMGQTYRNIEIICVNDGSTDNSQKILERLAKEDDRIFVYAKENGGPGDTRNLGIEKSTSEWVIFIDSDDTLREDAVEMVADAVMREEPDMVHYGIQVVSSDGSTPSKHDMSYYDIRYEGLIEINDSIIYRQDVSASNKAFKKSIINKYGIHFEKIHYEDFQFTIQYMSVISRVYFIKDKLYNYLRRDGSIMDTTFAGSVRAIDHIHAYNYILEFMKVHDILNEHRRMMVKLFNASYMFAIKYTVPEMIPQIVDYATELYNENGFLSVKNDRVVENGTVLFRLKKRKISNVLHKVFAIRYEYINYKLYKVVKILGVIVYKEARR